MTADGFGEGQAVDVRFPIGREQEQGNRDLWPWLPGTVEEQCGPDEWLVCVEDDRLATREDGTPPHPGDPSDSLLYPRCFRDPSELRPA